jgi:recombination protein RecA
VKDGKDVIGNRTRVRVKKNKVAPPFREAEFDIIYGEGISSLGELIDIGTEYDIIEKRGSWYSYQDDTIAQGREATVEWLEEHDEERKEIKFQVRKELDMLSDEEKAEVDAAKEADEEKEAEAEEA